MDKKFEEMYSFIKKNYKYSEWCQNRSFDDRLKEFLGEVDELKLAVKNNDMKNLKEEIGDVLWDLTFTIFMAEKEGLFKSDEVFEDVMKKIERRKPWIHEKRIVSAEEENKMWNDIKKREKNGEFD